MKTKLLSLLGCMFLAFVFVSCSDDDEEVNDDSSLLVGRWALDSIYGWDVKNGEHQEDWFELGDNDEFLTFKADGTGVEEISFLEYTQDFTWSLSGDILISSLDDDNTTNTILTLDETTLEIQSVSTYTSANGSLWEEYQVASYVRVEE